MNDFNNAISVMDSFSAKFEETMNNLKKDLQKQLETAFKLFFEKHPEVATIHWVQYTPYFNDGDECVFGVHELYFTKTPWNELENYWGEDDEGLISEKYWDNVTRKYVINPDLSSDLAEDMNKFAKVFGSLDDDIHRAAFGDHVWVMAHKDGFEVTNFHHD